MINPINSYNPNFYTSTRQRPTPLAPPSSSSSQKVGFSGVVPKDNKNLLKSLKKAKRLIKRKVLPLILKPIKLSLNVYDYTYTKKIKSSTIKKTVPVSVKKRKEKKEEVLNLVLSQHGNEYYYVLKNKDKNLAYIAFNEKKSLLEKNKHYFVQFLRSMEGRETHKGLDQILLQSLVEHKINKGELPFIKGEVVPGIYKPSKTIRTKSLYTLLGSEKAGFTPWIVGIKKEETALNLVRKMKKKGNYLFPETAGNIDKLLAKYSQLNPPI